MALHFSIICFKISPQVTLLLLSSCCSLLIWAAKGIKNRLWHLTNKIVAVLRLRNDVTMSCLRLKLRGNMTGHSSEMDWFPYNSSSVFDNACQVESLLKRWLDKVFVSIELAESLVVCGVITRGRWKWNQSEKLTWQWDLLHLHYSGVCE